MLKTVGIIGYGAFGRLVHTLLTKYAPGVQVRVYSSGGKPGKAPFCTFEDACRTDAIVLAIPISAFESTLRKALPYAEVDTVIVDVATVKSHTAKLLAKYAKGRRYLSTHPMFGPESYAKTGEDVAGFRIVIAKHTLSKSEYASLAKFLRGMGFVVVETTPAKHDQHLANTLFLTHFIGQSISRAGFTRTEIDTVSFGFLMEATESVKNDTQLFQDVYRYNPYCKDTMRKLAKAEASVQKLLGAKK